MAEILDFTGSTIMDVDPDKILEQAKGEYEHVVIIGVRHDYSTQVECSSTDSAKINFWLDCGKRDLFRTIEGDEE